MTIIDTEGREWEVSLNYKKNDGQSYIKRGWKPFLTANRLKGGTLCVEFLKGGSCPTLKCYRPNDIAEESNSTSETAPNQALAEDATTCSFELDPSQNLSCRLRISSYSFEKAVINLPAHFVRENHLECRRCEIKVVDEEERTWKVNLGYKGTCKSYICGGWRDVQNANGFRRGDILCFQLLQAGEHPILRCYRPNNVAEESNGTDETNPEEALAEDATTSSLEQDTSQYLSCCVRLSSYSVKKSIVYLPARFMKETHLIRRSCEVKVVDEEERTWKVSLGCRSTSATAYICRGWRDVQNANSFGFGDVVCFQLLEAGEHPTLRCYRVSRRKKRSNKVGRRPKGAA